jgi:hypothetical protein
MNLLEKKSFWTRTLLKKLDLKNSKNEQAHASEINSLRAITYKVFEACDQKF